MIPDGYTRDPSLPNACYTNRQGQVAGGVEGHASRTALDDRGGLSLSDARGR